MDHKTGDWQVLNIFHVGKMDGMWELQTDEYDTSCQHNTRMDK